MNRFSVKIFLGATALALLLSASCPVLAMDDKYSWWQVSKTSRLSERELAIIEADDKIDREIMERRAAAIQERGSLSQEEADWKRAAWKTPNSAPENRLSHPFFSPAFFNNCTAIWEGVHGPLSSLSQPPEFTDLFSNDPVQDLARQYTQEKRLQGQSSTQPGCVVQ